LPASAHEVSDLGTKINGAFQNGTDFARSQPRLRGRAARMRKRRFYMKERLCVEEQLFRADVEERLFRAVSACAFDCGLQPRPALKGIHPPAVAAMIGRSSTLMQALVLRARRSIQTEGSPDAAQVRVNHPRVSNTWRNREMG